MGNDAPPPKWASTPLGPILLTMAHAVVTLEGVEPVGEATRLINAVNRAAEYLVTVAENRERPR